MNYLKFSSRLEDAEHVAREWSRGSKEFDDAMFDSDWAGIVDKNFDLGLLIRFAKSEEWGDKQCYDEQITSAGLPYYRLR